MSLKVAAIVFVVCAAGNLVICDDIDWDEYPEYVVSAQDHRVVRLATYAHQLISARSPLCYTMVGTISATVQMSPNYSRYNVRFRVRYPAADGDGFHFGHVDVTGEIQAADIENGNFRIIEIKSRGNVEIN